LNAGQDGGPDEAAAACAPEAVLPLEVLVLLGFGIFDRFQIKGRPDGVQYTINVGAPHETDDETQ
jgi:hypothetical protein